VEELRPFTISKSILNEPTVLLTEEGRKYMLWCPITDNVRIIHYLRSFMLAHFKIKTFDTAKFSLRGTTYLCFETLEGVTELDEWHYALWENKRKFNQFLKPERLFQILLFEAVFPLFGGVNNKYILAGKKNRVVYHAIPPNNYESFHFNPISLSQQFATSPAYKLYFSYIKEDLPRFLEEFFSLCDERFKIDLKHQLSLFPERRNELWKEISPCFDPKFKTYVMATFNAYLMHL